MFLSCSFGVVGYNTKDYLGNKFNSEATLDISKWIGLKKFFTREQLIIYYY